jgi:chromosome segregation ATPase
MPVRHPRDQPKLVAADAPDPPPDFRGMIEAAVAPIREQLERAEQETATLRAELAELRLSEQAAQNLAEYGTAQAVDLRKRLEAAEQRGDDERDRADRAEKRADEERARADRERDRADQTEQRADSERERAGRAEERADKAEQQLARVEVELVAAKTEAAGLRCQLEQAKPPPDPPSSRLRRLLRALGHVR